MRLLLVLGLLQLAFGQLYYQQQRIPQRPMMYPVRTNCQYVWCSQNRYRWNYRPTAITEEPPTPPPETSSEISSTTRFLRPERKQNKKFENPCTLGKPLLNEFNTPITDTGEGNELVARWYYDRQNKQCRRFLYKGIRGNANNFVTKTQCVDACETEMLSLTIAASREDRSNPCRIGNPAVHKNQSLILCGPNDASSCPRHHYCHLGENPETTACCESSGYGINFAIISKKFYYNTFSKRCTEFVYRGMKGNENNFLTMEQCQEVCQKWTNPCPTESFASRKECSSNGTECGSRTKGNQNNFLTKTACESKCKRERAIITKKIYLLLICSLKSPCGSGEMLMTPLHEPRMCSPTSPCPQSHWCHVGITPELTVCCSTMPNTCEMPMMKGHGNSYLTRWHFDNSQKRCVKFIYSGEGGNQNMFLTQDDCEAICPVYENPCGSGKPLLVGNVPKVCSPAQRCPSTHFCHIGETRRCREFSYQGSKGNANNFLTMEDCELVCPVLPNPCKVGEPLLNALKEPIICGGEDSCINGYWCHVGGSPETTNCCPGTRRPCDLPLETGKGSETLERWFYDGGIQACRQACKGRLETRKLLVLTLTTKFTELNPCGSGEPLIGKDDERVLCTGGQKIDSCPSASPRAVRLVQVKMSISMSSKDIQRFISVYRNYCPHGIPLIESGQVKACGIDRGCPDGFICHMSTEFNVSICCQDPVDFCSAPRDPGPCTNYETRYGYNPATDTCVEYEYGGCDGTLNNFRSLQRCTEICCKEYKRKL
ncbi:unnamed protein product [Strongylus vulgaris]|uniref:BPTI/Kunitz inhibitor domain-containing protein n=1 Tax=Strongylus vulgaris TaxID=40348 RepID=A0A3P7L781_STRVU|nr:unnamed protein product [Strongylus vulgaris]